MLAGASGSGRMEQNCYQECYQDCFQFATGLHRGEMLGLSLADVDLELGRLRVRRQLERRRWRHGC